MSNKLYIGNLPANKRLEQIKYSLKKVFSDYGEIEKIFVVQDKQPGRKKAFGFVTFVDPKDAKAALAMDGEQLFGREMRVTFAREKGDDAPQKQAKTSFWDKLRGIFGKTKV